MKYILALSYIFTIFFVSCKDSSTSTDNSPSNLLPMKIGNYWIYDYYSIHKNNNSWDTLKGSIKLFVKDSFIWKNKVIYTLDNCSLSGGITWYINIPPLRLNGIILNDGLYNCDTTNDYLQKLLSFPIIINQETNKRICIDVNYPVNTPLGKFSTYRFTQDFTDYKIFENYCNDIGLVYYDAQNNSDKSILILKEYHLEKE